jgi:hypothetical protein
MMLMLGSVSFALGSEAWGQVSTLPVETVANAQCEGDFDGDRSVTVDEILTAVSTALNGCPGIVNSTLPEQEAQAGKNLAVGAYAACRQGVEAALALSGNTSVRAEAIAACEARFSATWLRAGEPTLAGESERVPRPEQLETVKVLTDAHSGNVARILSGGGLTACSEQVFPLSENLRVREVQEDVDRVSIMHMYDTARQNSMTAYCRCAGGTLANPTDPASGGYCRWVVSGSAASCGSVGCTGSCEVEVDSAL